MDEIAIEQPYEEYENLYMDEIAIEQPYEEYEFFCF
jgi:hypothetical protein